MAKYDFTPEMGEISGLGGGYEKACRTMLKAGMEWQDAHPGAVPLFYEKNNVLGNLRCENRDAEMLTNAFADVVPNYCGAMYSAVIRACFYIRKYGWDKYVKEMSEGDK